MIWDALIAPFIEFGFMRRALVGSMAISLAAAPVGVFVLLRQMSLMGDAVAHAILPGVAIGYLISGLSITAMTLGGIASGLVVALMAGIVSRITVLREDASLASFHLVSLAAGIVLLASTGSSVDLFHVLFGSVLALNDAALILLCTIASISLLVLAIIFRPLVLECMDPQFLRSVSGLSAVTHFGFLALVVFSLIAGFQALGTLMAVGMLIVPAAASRLWVTSVTSMMVLAVGIAIASCYLGLVLSFHFALETGPLIILIAGTFYTASIIFGPYGGVIANSKIGVNS